MSGCASAWPHWGRGQRRYSTRRTCCSIARVATSGSGRAVLRIRSVNGGTGGTLTYKGTPTQTHGVKAREEIEVVIADAAAAQALLAALGYTVVTSYRKQRETWYLDNVEVSLDTMFIGYFCEIEGPYAQILALGRRLGLSEDQVETAGYAELVIQAAGAGMTV